MGTPENGAVKSSVRFRWPAAVILAIGLLASPATASAATGIVHGPLRSISNGTSSNWSGYAAHGATFNSVSASWVQPAGQCTNKATWSAFWVGLDGYTSRTVEQTGSEVDCSGGSPVYYAWYEMYPANSVNFSNPVAPGDHFTASVTASGSNFTLTITDTTQGWHRAITKSLSSAQKSSAEVIAEAPCCTAGGGILPLTDFGTVHFTNAMANGSVIGNSSPTKINMRPIGGGTNTANTSSLSGGENFHVTWTGN
jgi:hypothetical protein